MPGGLQRASWCSALALPTMHAACCRPTHAHAVTDVLCAVLDPGRLLLLTQGYIYRLTCPPPSASGTHAAGNRTPSTPFTHFVRSRPSCRGAPARRGHVPAVQPSRTPPMRTQCASSFPAPRPPQRANPGSDCDLCSAHAAGDCHALQRGAHCQPCEIFRGAPGARRAPPHTTNARFLMRGRVPPLPPPAAACTAREC